MKVNIDRKDDSKAQYVQANELMQHKFLLACRLFMRGMARLESVRAAYPLRSLLEGKTQQHFARLDLLKSEENSLSKSLERSNIDELFAQGLGRKP